MRTKVITAALITEGVSNGVGHFCAALRRKPYTNRQPANVAASAMMNSQMASFFAGTENIGSLTTMLPGAPIEILASLKLFAPASTS